MISPEIFKSSLKFEFVKCYSLSSYSFYAILYVELVFLFQIKMSTVSVKCDIRYNLNNRTPSISREFQRAIIELHEDNNKYVLRASSDRKIV